MYKVKKNDHKVKTIKELNITKHGRSGCMTSGIIPTRMKVKLSCISTLHSLDTIQNLLTVNQTEAKGHHDNGKNKADMAYHILIEQMSKL